MLTHVIWRRLTEANPFSGEMISSTALHDADAADISEALFEMLTECSYKFGFNDTIEIKNYKIQ